MRQVLDFMGLWASFHFARLLPALERIQKDMFQRFNLPAADYAMFAVKVENLFLDPTLSALDEYGVSIHVSLKIVDWLRPDGDLDEVLGRLKRLNLESADLTSFEKSLIRDAQSYL